MVQPLPRVVRQPRGPNEYLAYLTRPEMAHLRRDPAAPHHERLPDKGALNTFRGVPLFYAPGDGYGYSAHGEFGGGYEGSPEGGGWMDAWQLRAHPTVNSFRNAKTEADKMQALKAMADFYTDGDDRGGFKPNVTKEDIENIFTDVKYAKLFLDLMVAFRAQEFFDPYIVTIKGI